ncbi:MAG: hypothetical protein O3B37_13595 [Proteobacteria bacterium]|nr:hypothetical protein [Pseudomonadota bacterium]
MALPKHGLSPEVFLTFWAFLPALTGFFVASYIDCIVENRPHDARTYGRHQVWTMMVATAVISMISLAKTSAPDTWPAVFWAFLVYAIATAGLIGHAIAHIFPKSYAKQARTANDQASFDDAEGDIELQVQQLNEAEPTTA